LVSSLKSISPFGRFNGANMDPKASNAAFKYAESSGAFCRILHKTQQHEPLIMLTHWGFNVLMMLLGYASTIYTTSLTA